VLGDEVAVLGDQAEVVVPPVQQRPPLPGAADAPARPNSPTGVA
jgi:hypothetical protein